MDDRSDGDRNSGKPVSSGERGSPASPPSLSELGARIDAARGKRGDEAVPQGQLKAERGMLGSAWRISVELLTGPLVGGLVGWWVDKWLGTKPVFLVVLLLLGAAAGLSGTIRAARQMNAAAERESDDGRKTD